MKRDPISATVLAASFAALAVIAAVFCFITAFELPMDAAFLAVLVIAAAAFGGAFAARARKGWLWLLIGSIVFAGAVVLAGGIGAGAVLADHVTMIYQQSYDWPATTFSANLPYYTTADMALVFIGGMLSAWAAFLMARRVPPIVPVALSVLPLVPCFMVLQTVPHVLCLFLLVFTLLTYLLSAGGNGKKPLTFSRTAITAASVLAVTAMLFVLIQPDGEYNKAGDRRDQLLSFLGIGTNGNGDTSHTAYEETIKMQFDEVGQFAKNGDDLVAKVYSEKEEILYLREQDYALYQYGSWLTQAGNEELFHTPSNHEDPYFVFIETPEPFSKQFVPYGIRAADAPHMENGNLYNMAHETAYEWRATDAGELWRQTVAERADHYSKNYLMYAYQGREVYLTMPMTTKLWAQEKLDTILTGAEMTNTEKADKVAAFVRNSAVYVRDSANWEWEGDDFAQWFIETQDEGNCVHFATAAAVLLRAADVPTRFVTGYLAETPIKQWVAVTEKDAHAWIEYYEPAIGCWVKLEATPIGAFSPLAEETSTRPSMETTATTQATTTVSPLTTSPTQLPAVNPQQTHSSVVWYVVLGVAAAVGMLYLQRVIRLGVTKKKQTGGSANERAHYYWCAILRLSKALREPPPTQAKALAEKAKFSQHTLSDEELASLVVCMEALRARVKAKPWYQQPWYCLVLALY